MAFVNPFVEFAKRVHISELVQKGRNILVVNSDEDPATAFKKIVDRNILSAPVWDSKEKKFIGFLDVKDLVSWLVFKAEEKSHGHDKEARPPSAGSQAGHHEHNAGASHLAPPPPDLRSFFDVAAKMYNEPLQGVTVSYLARRNAFHPISPDDTLLDLVRILAKGGVHRVPVVNKQTGLIEDIISQSNVIQLVYKHLADFHPLLNEHINHVKIGTPVVNPNKSNETALAVFKSMAKYNRSGVPVVDAQTGRFVANTSGSDLKLLVQNVEANMKMLNLPILDFLSEIRQRDLSRGTETKSPTISVHADESVEKVVSKLAATKVHRIFVAEDAKGFKPTAVISITDVLRFLLDYGVTGTSAAPKIVVDAN